jgi:hypothetical protein
MDNAPIDVMCNTIKNVMSSAVEAETGGIYMATQRACPIRITLAELGHLQPSRGTPIYNDNSTATGILNSSMRQNAFLLGQGPHQAKQIPTHLAKRSHQHGRLLHQTSSTLVPQEDEIQVSPQASCS